MGDAGPPTPPPGLAHGARLADAVEAHPAPLREVKVLVTGFGVSLFFLGRFGLRFLFRPVGLGLPGLLGPEVSGVRCPV